MSVNNMINPIGAVNRFPQMNPVQPIQMMPGQPVTIKIDIAPQPMYYPQADMQNNSVIYNIPQTSIFAPQKAEDKKVDETKATEKQVENKKVETKAVEAKKEEKKVEDTMAQILAAQAGVQQPSQSTQAKVAEVAPKAEKTEEKKEVKNNKPQIVAPEKMKTGIDLNGLISILTSPDYEEQADAMEAISEVTMYAPDRASELLDTKVVDTLLGIMSKDTSALQGKDKELAERNKEYAMFTTATLQKLYTDEIKRVGNADVAPEELIGMAGIVNNLKTNPNPNVREAAVASIGYVTNPNNKNVLGRLVQEATNDEDSGVRAQADKQLGKVLSFNA